MEKVVCPYCEEEIDIMEIDFSPNHGDDSAEVWCDHCNEKITVTQFVSTTYSVTKGHQDV